MSVSLEAGSFTVVAGRSGSGKTTLLKVLLGQLGSSTAAIHWNGRRVMVPSEFLVPPRCGFVLGVPGLEPGTVEESITMGLSEQHANLDTGVRVGLVREELARFALGLDSLLPGEVPTSLALRIAIARVFVRVPELAVFDDLSEGLNREAERQLWDRVFEQAGVTCLAVSNRRPALRRADQIVVLHEGRVAARGRLSRLLTESRLMRRLWSGGC